MSMFFITALGVIAYTHAEGIRVDDISIHYYSLEFAAWCTYIGLLFYVSYW